MSFGATAGLQRLLRPRLDVRIPLFSFFDVLWVGLSLLGIFIRGLRPPLVVRRVQRSEVQARVKLCR